MNKFVNVMLATCMLSVCATYAFAGGQQTVTESTDSTAAVMSEVQAVKSQLAQQSETLAEQDRNIDALSHALATKEDKMTSPWYVSANAGMTFVPSSDVGDLDESISYDDGYTMGIAVGREFNAFRAEIAFDYQQADNNTVGDYAVWGDASLTTLMANAYYTFPVMDSFGIYIMGGVGAGKFDLSNGSLNDDSIVFAGAGGLGVSYDISPVWAVDAGWKYILTSDSDIENTTVSYASNAAIVGVRYKF